MIPQWVYLAILAGLASNLYNIFNRFALRKDGDSTAYAWWTEFIRFFIALSFLSFDFSLNLKGNAVFILLLLGIVEAISAFIFMKMHQYTHLSISTIISRTRLVWIPIIAFFFLGERLNFIEYVGIGVLFLGLSIAVAPHKLKSDRGIQLSYLSALAVALLSVVMKSASSLVSTSVLLIFMSITSVIVFPFFMKNAKDRIIGVVRKNFLVILAASFSNTLSMYLYIFALRLGDVSKVTAIYQGMMIVSILGGIILLKERQDVLRKIIGALITIGGVILLTAK